MNAVAVALIGWYAVEAYLRWRNRSSAKSFEWSFVAVFATIAAAFALGFAARDVTSASVGGGSVAVAIGLAVLASGVVLRTWAPASS